MTTESPASRRKRPAAVPCPTCQTLLRGRYCYACGQDTHIRPRPLRDVAGEALLEITKLDAKAIRTMATLAVRPGRLLEAYRSGASGRYSTPLKMFVMMTAIFLAVLNFTDVQIYQAVWTSTPGVTPVATADPDGVNVHITGATEQEVWMRQRIEPAIDPRIIPALQAAAAKATNERDRQNLAYEAEIVRDQPVVTARLVAWMSNAMWLMMPVYAALLIPLFGRRRLFMEHLAFTMWAHAMGFTLLLLLALANRLGARLDIWPLLLPYGVYFTLAASQYYGVSRWGAAWRCAVHLALYFLLAIVPAGLVATFFAMDIGAYWAFVMA
ncbi:MAG: DUF3667 domain-containing protein [Brevundimonas sp.]|nr:MAG: DUF3667 domain-containing protein [Brevundimonas sp.]